MPESVTTTPTVAFRYSNFRCFASSRFLTVLASEMQSIAVAWQVYNLTHRPLDLGYVGLAQFLPGIFLFLVAGHAADRFQRPKILQICFAAFGLCSLLLWVFSTAGLTTVWPIYLVLLLNGAVRAFAFPAGQSLLPLLVPPEHFPNAVTWNSSVYQAASISGPIIGGVLYAVTNNASVVYVLAGSLYLAGWLLAQRLRPTAVQSTPRGVSLHVALEGFRYIWENKLILGCISLDLFAVLLGGAVALLPVYAREILHTGPAGLGLLRSAPGAGAIIMAIVLAFRPLKRRAGYIMLSCVAGFGLFTLVFGLSRNFTISLISLALVGASDMVSMVIRHVVTQLYVPDSVRGRISAVNFIFIGASNEIGQFESGITAQWFGAVPAVVMGGIGTLLVVIAWAWMFPELRNVNDLSARKRS